ncbi:MAG: hypothetical protein IJ397_00715 [Lachnospiraceae bacterium]|nr:hypothetical protein [Lachnospiraceae bacterium]
MSKKIKYTDPSVKRKRYNHNFIPGQNAGGSLETPNAKSKKSLIGDILLENTFILTKEMNKRYARQTYGIFHKKWRRNTFIIGLLLMLVSFVFVYPLQWYILWLIFLVLGIYVFMMSWMGYLYGAAVSYGNFKEFYGEPVMMTVQFYEKFFRVVTPKGNRDFLYANIKHRIEMGDMAILIVAQEGIILHGQIIDKKMFEPLQLSKYYDILEAAEVPIN